MSLSEKELRRRIQSLSPMERQLLRSILSQTSEPRKLPKPRKEQPVVLAKPEKPEMVKSFNGAWKERK